MLVCEQSAGLRLYMRDIEFEEALLVLEAYVVGAEAPSHVVWVEEVSGGEDTPHQWIIISVV